MVSKRSTSGSRDLRGRWPPAGRQSWPGQPGPARSRAETGREDWFHLGNLLVSESYYDARFIVPRGRSCRRGGTGCVTATADGATRRCSTTTGRRELRRHLADLPEPADAVRAPARHLRRAGLVTSFSSKSELALNLSPDGRSVSFMGYVAKPDRAGRVQLQHAGRDRPDEPGAGRLLPGGGPDAGPTGRFEFTETNAYSGNNGRAAITPRPAASELIYTAGNAGNGGNPQPTG